MWYICWRSNLFRLPQGCKKRMSPYNIATKSTVLCQRPKHKKGESCRNSFVGPTVMHVWTACLLLQISYQTVELVEGERYRHSDDRWHIANWPNFMIVTPEDGLEHSTFRCHGDPGRTCCKRTNSDICIIRTPDFPLYRLILYRSIYRFLLPWIPPKEYDCRCHCPCDKKTKAKAYVTSLITGL